MANGWLSQSAMDKLREQLADGKITSLFQHNVGYNQMYLVSMINSENLASLQSFQELEVHHEKVVPGPGELAVEEGLEGGQVFAVPWPPTR